MVSEPCPPTLLSAFAVPLLKAPSHSLRLRYSPKVRTSTFARPLPSHAPSPRSSRLLWLSAVTETKIQKNRPEAAPDDPYHLDTVIDDRSAPFAPKMFHSSLTALIAYYSSMCRTQPFMMGRLILAVASILTAKTVGLAVPLLLKFIIDNLSKPRELPWLMIVSAILLHGLANVLASIAHELRNGFFAKAGQRVGRSITATSFAHILSLEQAFHNTSRTGALTRVIDRGTRSVLTIFRALVFAFFPTLFELVLVCGVLLKTFSYTFVLVTVVAFVAFIWWTLSVNDRLSRARAETNEVENDASAKLTDSLMNMEAVKCFDNAGFEIKRYDDTLARYEACAIRNEWLFARLNMGQRAIYTAGLTCNLLLAARGVVNGSITVGSVVLLTSMLQQLWAPLNFLGWQYREVKQSLIDLQNLFDILKRKSKVKDSPYAKPLVVTGGAISFENVSFQYPESDDSLGFSAKKMSSTDELVKHNGSSSKTSGKLAVNGLSFYVAPGKSLALVGTSGSGKSTATRLLCRLYDVSGGRICIDGQDISKATIASVRQAVSIVPQDTALFNDTIAYNIRYGKPSATDEEVVAAAKAASIHDVVMATELGYQTLVGERGIRLSGGERQRLSVARAFLKGSSIILEDESTSALDSLTEMEVSEALQKLGINRTRIVVAHRLSTIMNVDQIVVMTHGKKVEEGSFVDLMQFSDGAFRNMWERQQRQVYE